MDTGLMLIKNTLFHAVIAVIIFCLSAIIAEAICEWEEKRNKKTVVRKEAVFILVAVFFTMSLLGLIFEIGGFLYT